MVYFPAVHSLPTPTPHPSPLSYVFPLSPPSRRLPGSKERLHTHIHPTMPLRVIRMSLFTSWSVQVVGKQIQSLPDYVSRSPTLTSIHLLSVWNAQGSNAFAANIATIIYCTYNAFKIFGVKFKDKFKIIENNLIVFMHLAVVRITSFGIEESFLALITFISSYIGCQWCVWWLLAVTRLSFPCVSNQSIGLFAPPSNFDVTIDCSHLPLNSKVRGAELHFWIALTFALHMLSGFTEPRAKQTWCSQARGCVTARQRCDVFFFPLTHPLRMMYMWLIFLLPLSLTCFRCSALSRTESRLDQCIVFLFQSHSSELKTRKVTQVRFGRVWKQSSASGGPLKAGVWVCLGCLCVRACMCVGEKRSERKTNMQREVEQIHVFLTTSSSGLTSLSSCLLCALCLFFTGNHFPCLCVTLALPSHIKLQVLHKCLSSHLPLDNLQEDYSSFLCLPHKWFSETHTKAICSTTWAVGHRSRKRRLHIRHEDQSLKHTQVFQHSKKIKAESHLPWRGKECSVVLIISK